MRSQESHFSENKQSLALWREIVESVAAFATASGGTIHVGISPNGEKVGIRIGKGTLEDLANKIKVNTDPSMFPSISMEGPEDSAIIVIQVEESPLKPVWAFGRPIKRVGRTNQQLSRNEAQRITEICTGRTWDALPCVGFKASDIDKASIGEFLSQAELPRTSAEKLIKNLALETSGRHLSNAAVLLFSKNPQRYFPEAQVKCARFKGDNSVDFIDEKTFEGNIISQIDSALAFVTRNTRTALSITGKAAREVIAEYPADAVREAVTNAICHRDYSVVGTIQVRIYDNSLEIWNPGRLPQDFPVRDLYKKHPSRPHNPKIAQAFYRARLIEHWGTGTLRMLESCRKQDIRLKMTVETGQFKIQFIKAKTILRPLSEGSEKSSEKSSEKIVSIMRQKPRVTIALLSELAGMSTRAVEKWISRLKEDGQIKRIGPDKGGYWRVMKS